MRVTYDLPVDDFKAALFLMDEAVGRLAQIKDSGVAYLFERIVSTLVMSQEEHECDDCEQELSQLADAYSAGLMKIIERLK